MSNTPDFTRNIGDSRSYTVRLQVTDNAGNQIPFAALTSSFTLDTTVPKSSVTLPSFAQKDKFSIP